MGFVIKLPPTPSPHAPLSPQSCVTRMRARRSITPRRSTTTIPIQIITMVKSLGSLLSRAEGRLAPLLRLHVHASTQQMAQGDLVPVLHRADKKKRDIVKQLLEV